MSHQLQGHASKSKPKALSLEDWERGWVRNWSKAGTRGYELPSKGPGSEEATFLTQVRTPEKEIARLKRIQDEFIR